MNSDALLAGASGLVGHEIARQWPGPGTLHLLLRRAAPAAAGRRVQVVDYAALPMLPSADVAFCALGTTIKVAGSQAAFRAVDFDAVLAFAHAAKAAGVSCFATVSALGADAKSRNFYSRVKGEVEGALASIGFRSLLIARPSLLTGNREALGQPPRSGERLVTALTAPLAPLMPAAWRPITAATVALALLRAAAAAQPGVQVLSSARLQALGK
jgi:uncharacterized protein YbjT (DUF2867 family)